MAALSVRTPGAPAGAALGRLLRRAGPASSRWPQLCAARTYYVDAQSRVAEPLVPPCMKGIAARYFFVACVARPEDRGRRDTPKHKNMCYPKLSPAEYVLGLRYTAKGAAMEVPCPWGSLEAV
eukprot:GHVT01035130.1.p1 GENE.GHVT01035130.1~~GHVT01035130.1.p1  ORF type:complete len:135 (+),score=26.85 GHVT01035130.1:37-405(+)